MDLGRVQKELREITRDTQSGVRIEVIGDNINHLTGFLKGPRDTAYEGGIFKVDIVLGERFSAETYASASQATQEDPKVKRMMDMGFPRATIMKALSQARGDENGAIEIILSGL